MLLSVVFCVVSLSGSGLASKQQQIDVQVRPRSRTQLNTHQPVLYSGHRINMGQNSINVTCAWMPVVAFVTGNKSPSH